MLLALVDSQIFESVTEAQRSAATAALEAEIASDEALRQRLFAAIEPTVRQMNSASTS